MVKGFGETADTEQQRQPGEDSALKAFRLKK